jgi:hypothetical protein
LWPDFNEDDYNKIIFKFLNSKRNYGSIWWKMKFQKELLVH